MKTFKTLAAASIAVAVLAAPAADAKPFFRGAIANGVKHLAKEVAKHPVEAIAIGMIAACPAVPACTVVVGAP